MLTKDVDLLQKVALAAFEERCTYRMARNRTREFLLERGWKKEERGKFLSPHDHALYHGLKALKIERNVARNKLEKCLALAGLIVETKS